MKRERPHQTFRTGEKKEKDTPFRSPPTLEKKKKKKKKKKKAKKLPRKAQDRDLPAGKEGPTISPGRGKRGEDYGRSRTISCSDIWGEGKIRAFRKVKGKGRSSISLEPPAEGKERTGAFLLGLSVSSRRGKIRLLRGGARARAEKQQLMMSEKKKEGGRREPLSGFLSKKAGQDKASR